MGNLVNKAQTAYNEWKSSNPASITDWQNATDVEIAALFRQEQIYQQAIHDAKSIESSFYAARTEAFAALEQQQVMARTALQNLWQSKEDNDFDVDYV